MARSRIRERCVSIMSIGNTVIERVIFFNSVNVEFEKKDGEKMKVRGKIGDNVLYLAHRYDIALEGE